MQWTSEPPTHSCPAWVRKTGHPYIDECLGHFIVRGDSFSFRNDGRVLSLADGFEWCPVLTPKQMMLIPEYAASLFLSGKYDGESAADCVRAALRAVLEETDV